jgi:hypothetical protein
MKEHEFDRVGRICDNYAVKLSNGRGACRRDGNIKAQAENYAATQARIGRLRAETAAVLEHYKVPTIARPFYYSFVLKLARLDREGLSEQSRRIEGRLQVDLWAGRGLERNTLVEVALQVLCMDLRRDAPDPCGADETRVELVRG